MDTPKSTGPHTLAHVASAEIDFAVLLDMRRNHNELLPVARLPPEVLVMIFADYLRIYSAGKYSRHYPWPSKTSLWTITQVCHYWRETALSHPLLWSSFWANAEAPNSNDYVCMMLERSKTQPLDIDLIYGSEPPAGVSLACLILGQIHRIRRLYLESLPFELLQELGPRPAPFLNELILADPDRDEGSLGMIEACDMPALRALTLSHYEVLWGSTLFRPSLTALTLTAVPSLADESEHALLDALEHMPLLESLTLANCLPSDPDAAAPPDRLVRLPRLRRLRAEDTLASVGRLLHCIAYPASAAVTLQFYETDGVQHLLPLVDKLRGVRVLGTAPPPVCVALHGARGGAVLFECWAPAPPRLPATPDSDPPRLWRKLPLRVAFGAPGAAAHIPEAALRTLLPAPHALAALRLQPPYAAGQAPYVPVAAWRACCAPLRNLRALCVGWWGEHTFPEVLAPASPGAEPLLPCLQRLCVAGAEIRRPPGFPFRGLAAALAHRKAAGRPLRELRLTGCYGVDKSEVDALARVVGAVVWDGVSLDVQSRWDGYSSDWDEYFAESSDSDEEEEEEEEDSGEEEDIEPFHCAHDMVLAGSLGP